MAYAFSAPPHLGWLLEAAAEVVAGGAVFGFADDGNYYRFGGAYYIDFNDTVRTFSFKKPYKYLSLGSYYDFITYGDAFIEVKEGSRSFKVTLFEWPGNNDLFKREDDELRDVETELAELLAKPCVLVETDSLNVYYPNFSRVDFVTGVMPDKLADTSVVLCCEAAFTGECLTEFKHTNIAGDHVSSGERFRGYQCKKNTGAFVL